MRPLFPSKLCWLIYPTECDKKTSVEILDSFFDFGGNFVRILTSKFGY